MGEWVENRDQFMDLIQKGFSGLFSTSHLSSCRLSAPSCASSLSNLEAQNLDVPCLLRKLSVVSGPLSLLRPLALMGFTRGFLKMLAHYE
jgi:hypothetical protein